MLSDWNLIALGAGGAENNCHSFLEISMVYQSFDREYTSLSLQNGTLIVQAKFRSCKTFLILTNHLNSEHHLHEPLKTHCENFREVHAV